MTKESLSSYDLYKWLDENAKYFSGAFIQKVYQNEEQFILRIYHRDFGKKDFFIDFHGAVYFGTKTEGALTHFIQQLRKLINNMKIQQISQLDFDRIIKIDGYPNLTLVIELFRQGNLLVLNNGMIELVYRPKTWKTRSLVRGAMYMPPPKFKSPVALSFAEFKNILTTTDKSIGHVLAQTLNLGKYAEELCYRANIPCTNKASTLEIQTLNSLYALLQEFLQEPVQGYIVEDFGAVPVPIKSKKTLKSTETFNAAIFEVFSQPQVPVSKEMKIYEWQLKALKRMEQEEQLYRKQADLIYKHYTEITDMLKNAKNTIKTQGWAQVVHMLGAEHVNTKTRKILVTFDDVTIEIDPAKNIHENAQQYYDQAKKLKSKIEGLKKVLKKPQPKPVQKKPKPKRQHFWFEKYHWFLSSEGVIVIGGKDAKTNEIVVKKYLTEKDKYVHADVHGAPSVIVKGEVSDKTIKEACVFSLAFSKAWNAGFHMGDSYWVTFSQVSKMAETGEYVAKGAWIIRGKRNYCRHLKIELAIGPIQYQNTQMLMIGPVSAVDKWAKHYFVLEPGDKRKDKLAKILATALNASVDEVMRLLPGSTGKIIKEVKH